MKLSVVVPVYQEEEVIDETIFRLTNILEKIDSSYEIIFCVDPGKDSTAVKLKLANRVNPRIKILEFSRRFGQPAATIAGLLHSTGEFTCVIDADLQDPPELIPQMVEECQKGFDVVLATRRSRNGEKISRKFIAKIAYRFIDSLSELEIPKDTGDCRMFSRRALEALLKTQDQDAFLRGMTAYIGFKQTKVFFDRDPRTKGNTKYNSMTGSMRIGMNGIIGYSQKPLAIMATVGFLIAGSSLFLAIYFFGAKLFFKSFTPGLSTMGILLTFFSGVQIFSIGVLGAYMGRIYSEVRNRPIFIVQEKTGFGEI